MPGPAVLYIVARSMHQGRAAGIASAAGVQVGAFVHIAAAAFGLSALLVSSALAFGVVKYLGAGYLVLLGLRKLVARADADVPGEAGMPAETLPRIFVQGIVVNASIPRRRCSSSPFSLNSWIRLVVVWRCKFCSSACSSSPWPS